MIPKWLTRLNEDGKQITREEFEALVEENKFLNSENNELVDRVNVLERDNAELKQNFDYMVQSLEDDIPSIAIQAKDSGWELGWFDFGKAKNPDVRFFNCSLIRWKGELFLFARRSHNVANLRVGMNDVVAFKLNENLSAMSGVKVGFPTTLREQHHEDPRITQMFGHLFVSATTFSVSKDRKDWTGAHQVVGRLNDNFQVDYPADPIYGHNGGSPLMNTGNEKNWLWFEHDGAPHLVYMTDPEHIVVRFKQNLIEPDIEYKTPFGHNIWKHGHIRGGTTPVLVGDHYWTFFHSSTPWFGPKRRYHMGALAFEAKPPFKITRYTPLPLLSGSKKDEWHDFLPLVVFPCGSIFENGMWTISMGVNDCTSAWIKIPHADLKKLTKSTNEPVKALFEKGPQDDGVSNEGNGPNEPSVAPEPPSRGDRPRVAKPTPNKNRTRNARKRKPDANGSVPDGDAAGRLPPSTGA